jgi:hypothetical protein
MSASAKNMEAIYKAKAAHDANCPFGGEGKRVLMHPFDIERMRWDEGDIIAGLLLISDTAIVTGMLKVECDAEPDGTPLEKIEQVEKEVVTV